MRNYSTYINKALILFSLLLGIGTAQAQDDIYYMPSKDTNSKNESTAGKTILRQDTTGMTDYQKYRAMRDGDNYVAEATDSITSEPNNSPKEDQDPAYAFSTSDTLENGTLVVNNYYFEEKDSRFQSYRSFYFDYYDPYYWDYYPSYSFGYAWGSPYYGYSFGFGYSNPYYYWGRPNYWYYPFYSNYYGGYYSYSHGYYDGYYSGQYNRIHSQMNSSGGSRRNFGQYNSRTDGFSGNSGNNSLGSNRRSSVSNSIRPETTVAVGSSRRSSANVNATNARGSNYSRSTVQTTRPNNVDASNRRAANYYVPSYNRGNQSVKQNYTNTGQSRRQVNTTNPTIYNASGRTYNSNTSTLTRKSTETSTSTPRRNTESYTPPARTQSTYNNDGESRRSTNTSTPTYSGGNSSRSSGASAPSNSGNSGGGSRRR